MSSQFNLSKDENHIYFKNDKNNFELLKIFVTKSTNNIKYIKRKIEKNKQIEIALSLRID